MKVLLIRTFPSDIQWRRPTYNVQELGLAAALRRRGVETDVMCCAKDGHADSHPVTLGGTTVTLHRMKAFCKVKNNAWFVGTGKLESGYDILLSGEYNELYTWHLAKTRRDKLICYHGPYYHPFNRGYNRMAKVFDAFFLRRYKRLKTPFLTKSEFARSYLEQKGLRRVRTVGVGLDVSFFGKEGALEIARRKGPLELLYLGVLTERRNVLFLLDIAKTLKARGIDYSLTVIGQFGDEDYKRRFWKTVTTHGLEGTVRHVPLVEQKDLPEVYGKSDIFLFPTRYDIFGMVLLEAMHFGKAVLSTQNGGSDMLIEDGVNGYAMTEADAEAWADRICILAARPDLRASIGAEAKKTVDSRFTWDALSGQFISAFELFLSGKWA